MAVDCSLFRTKCHSTEKVCRSRRILSVELLLIYDLAAHHGHNRQDVQDIVGSTGENVGVQNDQIRQEACLEPAFGGFQELMNVTLFFGGAANENSSNFN